MQMRRKATEYNVQSRNAFCSLTHSDLWLADTSIVSHCSYSHACHNANSYKNQPPTRTYPYSQPLNHKHWNVTPEQIGYIPFFEPETKWLKKINERKQRIHSKSKPCAAIMANCLPSTLCLPLTGSVKTAVDTKQDSCFPLVASIRQHLPPIYYGLY